MSFSTLRYLGYGAAALVFASSIYACSADSAPQQTFNTGTGGSGATAGNAGAAGTQDASAGGDGDVGQGGSAGGGIILDATIGDGAMNSETACVASQVEAVPIPLDLYFMLDKSGSMGSSCGDDGTCWTAQSNALKSFFNDPQSSGLWIAMSFFPQDTESPNCDGSQYLIPQVGWLELPGAAPTLITEISKNSPTGGTPTQDALNGVLKGAKNRQIQMTDHLVAAVIVSDGIPEASDCTKEDDFELQQIAQQYANGTPPIKTFSIFVDPSAHGVMDAIAEGGGTGVAYDATAGAQAFINAFNKIKTVALSCDFKIPQTDGGKIDPSKVNVAFSSGGDAGVDAGVEQILKVDNLAACNNGPGWYYDNNDNPTQIKLCPASCDAAKKDASSKVEILLGCKSETR